MQARFHTHHVVAGLNILPDTMAYKRWLVRAVDKRHKFVFVVFWKILILYLWRAEDNNGYLLESPLMYACCWYLST